VAYFFVYFHIHRAYVIAPISIHLFHFSRMVPYIRAPHYKVANRSEQMKH